METPHPSPTPDVLLAQTRFVNSLARALLADDGAAEDLAQETWLRYLQHPPRALGATRAWLRSVTSHLAVEGLRTRARRAAREERAARLEALPSVEDELAHTEILRSAAGAVLALEEPYRTTVLLAYWRGWDARRIAHETGTPLATVRSRLQRAHQKLRERLDASHGREAWALALSSLPALQGGGSVALAAGVVVLALVGAGLYLRWRRTERSVDPALADSRAAGTLAPSGLGVPGVPSEPPPATRTEVARATRVLRVSGTVFDLACDELALPARPAAGLVLRVFVIENEFDHFAPREVTTTTDEAGRFATELPDPGGESRWVSVLAVADEHYRALKYTSAPGAPAYELVLRRAPHGVLHGSVDDEHGSPVSGVVFDLDGVEVSSDAEGRFATRKTHDRGSIELRSLEYALLGWEGGRALEEGGFTSLRVHVGPAARLRVRVVDRAGQGLAGVGVRVTLPGCEQARIVGSSVERRARLLTSEPAVTARTDEDGVALLERLWSDCKLRVRLEVGCEQYACEAMRAGRLLLAEGGDSGQPIVIARGAELVLEAPVDAERDIAGLVRLPDGSPVPGARVKVTDLGRGDEWCRPLLLSLSSDELGRFAGHVRTATLVGPLRVTASAAEDPTRSRALTGGLQGLGYGGPRRVGDVDSLETPAAHLDIAPGDGERLAELVLTLGPRHAIRGTLLDFAGRPVARLGMGGSRVWAAPEGSAYHGHGVQGRAIKGRPGAFEIPGLEPGRYDVFVSEELEDFYSFENFLHRFPGIEAGAGEFELRLPARREVHIRVRLSGGEPSSTLVLHRKLFPSGPLETPHARALERVVGASPWPSGVSYGFAGISGDRTELGQARDGLDSFEGRERALHPLEPGWYVIGVHPAGPENEAGYFPQATPLLWFDEGEHVVEFELLPSATLRGRVLGDSAREFLALTLADERGALVSLAAITGSTQATSIVDTSANGEFVLHHAPSGAFRLRCGSRAELARGEFRVELPLTLRPGENPRVEVRP